jgi:hypothetical protein
MRIFVCEPESEYHVARAIDQVREALQRYTYKPGYAFKAVESDIRDAVRLVVTTPELKDSDGGRIPLYLEYMRTYRYDVIARVGLKKIVGDLVYAFETHEADEWLKCEGQRLAEPHAHARYDVINYSAR